MLQDMGGHSYLLLCSDASQLVVAQGELMPSFMRDTHVTPLIL
jgi:hypothetical protein